jgi:hypothetical protein
MEQRSNMDVAQELTLRYSLTFRELLEVSSHFSIIKLPHMALVLASTFALIGPYLICSVVNGLCRALPWPQAYVNFEMMLVSDHNIFSLLMGIIAYSSIYIGMFLAATWQNYKSNQFLYNDVSAIFTTQYIISKTLKTETKIDWATVIKVTQNKSLIMLQLTKTPPMVLAIPKRIFESSDKAEEFYNFANQQWNSKS